MLNAANLRNNADERTSRLLAAKAASGKSWDEIANALGLQNAYTCQVEQLHSASTAYHVVGIYDLYIYICDVYILNFCRLLNSALWDSILWIYANTHQNLHIHIYINSMQ